MCEGEREREEQFVMNLVLKYRVAKRPLMYIDANSALKFEARGIEFAPF